MKFKIQNVQLKKLIVEAAEVAKKKSELPIREHALLELKDGVLKVLCANSQCQVTGSANNIIADSDITFTVPAAKLKSICSSLADTDLLEFDVRYGEVKLKVNRSKFKMVSLPHADYPSMSTADFTKKITVDTKVFQSLIHKVMHTIPDGDVRYYLNGMHVELSGSLLKVVGTDGHRLATAEVELDASYEPVSFILPIEAVSKVLKFVSAYQGDVVIGFDSNLARFECGDFVLDTLLIDGKYPDYARVIPKDNTKAMQVDKDVLLNALKRVSVLAHSKHNACTFSIKSGEVALYASNSESENANDIIEVDYSDVEFDFSFKLPYMLEALASIPESQVNMVYDSVVTPVILSGVGDMSSVRVIMPVRV